MGHCKFLIILLAAGSLTAAESVIITGSASTNTPGFRLEIPRSGNALYTATPRHQPRNSEGEVQPIIRRVPGPLATRLYADLDRMASLSSLPHQACMKSASFGTTLVLSYRGQDSPDLTCGDHGDARLKALIADTNEIMQALKIP